MKRGKKAILDLGANAMLAAGMSQALGSMNNSVANTGALGLSNMAAIYPAIGTLQGTKMLLDSIPMKKRRR